MKKIAGLWAFGFLAFVSCKQDVKNTEPKPSSAEKTQEVVKVQTIALEQTSGEFNKKELALEEGVYVFEIANKDVDHEVGFVLAPKGKTDEANHIEAAYVKAPVAKGSTSLTREVGLTKGEYVYFCPLNPTPQYTLVVR